MRFAPHQLIQIGTALYYRPNPAGGLSDASTPCQTGANVMLGAKHVRQVFCKFAFGFLQNLTKKSE
jgi:hypothetical protein